MTTQDFIKQFYPRYVFSKAAANLKSVTAKITDLGDIFSEKAEAEIAEKYLSEARAMYSEFHNEQIELKNEILEDAIKGLIAQKATKFLVLSDHEPLPKVLTTQYLETFLNEIHFDDIHGITVMKYDPLLSDLHDYTYAINQAVDYKFISELQYYKINAAIEKI